MKTIVKVFFFFGSLICHQLPSRTLYVDGLPLPLCARDTGIYLGIFIGLAYVIVMKRFYYDLPPATLNAAILCLVMLPMPIDGIGSYLGVWKTNNIIRLFSGLFFGIPIPLFLIPTAGFNVYGGNKNRIIKHWIEIVLLLFIGAITGICILKYQIVSWLILAFIVISAFIFLSGRIVYTIGSRIGIVHGRFGALWIVAITGGIYFLMFIVSNFVLQPLKFMLGD